MVDVKGVMNFEEGMGWVVCMAYEGGRTDGLV